MSFNPLSYPVLFAAPRSLSGPSAWVQHIPFAMLAVQLVKPAVVVELGTHHGDSYLAFCQGVVAAGLSTRSWAIDTWTGDAQSGFYGPEVLEALRRQHDPEYGNFSTLVEQDFDSACARFGDATIDLLHIDGTHAYQAVKHDFESWLPKMTQRGVVLFHDTQTKQQGFEVWRLWKELSSRYLSFEFEHGYGLGVLAVGAQIEPEMRDFLEFAAANPQPVRQFFAAQGERIEYLRRLVGVATALARQSSHFQAASIARGQHWPLPVDSVRIFDDVMKFASAMGTKVEALLQENAQLRRMIADKTK